MGPPPFISKFNLVSESPVIQPPAPRGVVCIHFYEKGKERQKIQKNALKQHFLGIGCLQVALSYECHYTPHRMPKTQNQWEPVEAELLLVFYSFHYTLMYIDYRVACARLMAISLVCLVDDLIQLNPAIPDPRVTEICQ